MAKSNLKSWTKEVLDWSGDTPVLLGLPAYDDANAGYHRPDVENLEHSLKGIHASLASFKNLPKNYHGIALYSEWEMDDQEWNLFTQEFAR